MSVINKLAVSLGRKDEIPNQQLAGQIVNDNDKQAVKELIENLANNNKDIQSDCIKVIYEIGALNPKLIAPFSKELIDLLKSKNNRLQWGVMMALNTITSEVPGKIISALSSILNIADKGSVITNDHCVGILLKLCSITKYKKDVFHLLIERLAMSPVNQLPMYAENAVEIIDKTNKALFLKTLSDRLPDIEKDTKRARVEKVIRKLSK